MSTTKCPVPLLQDEYEFEQLLNLYEITRPRIVLEIGTFFGGTLWHWLNHNDNLSLVVCIDLEIHPRDPRFLHMLACKAMWKEWKNWHRVDYVEGNSHDKVIQDYVKCSLSFMGVLTEKSSPDVVDWLFIDGDHSYQGVKKDWEDYSPFVREGGFVIFHDIVTIPAIAKLWAEVKKCHQTTEIFSPGGWGIGIVKMGPKVKTVQKKPFPSFVRKVKKMVELVAPPIFFPQYKTSQL